MKKSIAFVFVLYFISSNGWSQNPFGLMDAERHKLYTIKEAMTAPEKVRGLAIVRPSDLKALINNLKDFQDVEKITFFPKSIKTLPASIAELKNLKVCLIGHHHKIDYNSVLQSISELKGLQKLGLTGLDEIPLLLSTIQRLEFLDLSGGKFEQLPAFMSSLKIKTLDFARCEKLTDDGIVPLFSNPAIVNLRLYGNYLKRFPDVQKMKSLSLLDVSENKIETLTCTSPISNNSLSTLLITGNPLERFDETFFHKCFPSLKSIQISKIGAAKTPVQNKLLDSLIAQFPNLQVF
jgi:Leucine-rich repeat (LRR) protein